MKFNVNGGSGNVGDGGEGGSGEDDGGAGVGGARDGGESAIDDPDLNGLVSKAGFGHGSAYAPHHVLPPTRCAVVPHPLARRSEHAARLEFRQIAPVTRGRCMCRIFTCTTSQMQEKCLWKITYVYMGVGSERQCQCRQGKERGILPRGRERGTRETTTYK